MSEPVGGVVVPETLEAAAGAIAGAAARGETVTFRGGGTALGFGYPAERTDLTVDTRALARIVEYAPSDMVVEAEAGCTLAALQAHLAPHRQRLALDPPDADRATLGGLLATNAFGPRRARFGSLRDLIVGISLIRADGVRVRGGGKVVKNVAGFDLPKIAVGSLGSLGMIATATLRLHPMPEARALACVPSCGGAHLRAIVRELTARQLEPAALLAVDAAAGDGAYDAYVLFEGFAAGVAEQSARFVALVRALGLGAGETVDRDPEDLASLDGNVRSHGDLRLRLAAPPAVLEGLQRDAVAPLVAALAGARVALYPSVGIAFVSAAVDDPEAACASIARARERVEALGGNLVVTEARAAVSGGVDPFGTLPDSFALMRELKTRFDPERRLNRGRFLGRL